jgi:hypothetical protein
MLCTGTDTEIDRAASHGAMLAVANNELTYGGQFRIFCLPKLEYKIKLLA